MGWCRWNRRIHRQILNLLLLRDVKEAHDDVFHNMLAGAKFEFYILRIQYDSFKFEKAKFEKAKFEFYLQRIQ